MPVPILAGLMLVFWGSGLRSSHESMGLLVALNLVFGLVFGLATAGYLARSFLLQGSPGYLMLSGGLVIWGLTGAIAAYASHGNLNLLLTIHNVALWFGSLCHLAGAILEAKRAHWVRRRPECLVLTAFGALCFVSLVILFARQGWVVTFFTPGRGTTLVRQLLIGSAMATFAVTAFLLKQGAWDAAFRSWYTPGLCLIVVGLGGLAARSAPGSLVGWAGRSAIYLGGTYLLLGARKALNAARNETQGREPVWTGKLPGLLLAPLLVVAATVLRLTFMQAMGHTFAFIALFPAVVLAALLGGFRAGVLATLLSGLAAHFFWDGPGAVTHLGPSQWLEFVFSLVCCLLISAIIEALHRAQTHAAEAEARDRTSAILAQGAEELRRTVAELTRSNRDLEQFAYVASHDLQEPLRMVHAYIELFATRYRGSLDAQADQYLSFAMGGATRMRALISDLLTYSRVGAPGAESLSEIELQDCLDEALAGLQGSLAASGGQITRDPLPRAVADPIQIAQVFSNLVGNSLKFMGKDLPRIHVSSWTTDAEVGISVADNGIGIDPSAHLKVFDIFMRLHNRDTFPGTGIGLAVCRKIVERHGGRIWIESSPENGATFFFTLPRKLGGAP